MTGGYGPFRTVLKIRAGENLAHRQGIWRQVVIAQRSGLVGIVQYHQPPGGIGRLRPFGNKTQIRIDAPGRREIPADLLLQRGDCSPHFAVAQDRALVQD